MFIKEIFRNEVKSIKENPWGGMKRVQKIAWPSEATAQLGSITTGTCKRELFYKFIGSTSTNPETVRARYIMDAGKMYENYHVNKLREMGILVNDQVKIEYEMPNTRNKVRVSGKCDCVVKDGKIKKAIEMKSVSAWKAPETMGNPKTTPLPAANNLMQAMLYKYYYKHVDQGKLQDVDEIYLQYINRSDGSTFYYKVDLDDDGYGIITAIDQTGKELYTLNLKDCKSFDDLLAGNTPATKEEARLAEIRVSIYDIFSSFDDVYANVDKNQLPPKDFKLVYTQEDIEREHKLGRLSKIKYNKACKGTEEYGDNRCAYCSFQKKCLEDSGVRLK